MLHDTQLKPTKKNSFSLQSARAGTLLLPIQHIANLTIKYLSSARFQLILKRWFPAIGHSKHPVSSIQGAWMCIQLTLWLFILESRKENCIRKKKSYKCRFSKWKEIIVTFRWTLNINSISYFLYDFPIQIFGTE